MNETMRAYIAGIIDGEGSIFFGNNSKDAISVVRLNVGMTNEAVPKLLHELFGGSLCTFQGTKKLVYKWDVYGRKVVAPLEAAYPYLLVKKKRAELALMYASLLKKQGEHGTLTDDEIVIRSYIIDEVTMMNHAGMEDLDAEATQSL